MSNPFDQPTSVVEVLTSLTHAVLAVSAAIDRQTEVLAEIRDLLDEEGEVWDNS